MATDPAPQPAWKRVLLDQLDNHAVNYGFFALVIIANYVVLFFLFDVNGMNAHPKELTGMLVAVATLLGLAEVALLHQWLGGGPFFFELRSRLGIAFVCGWAAFLIGTLAYCIRERTGGADERDREIRAAEERAREERRQMLGIPSDPAEAEKVRQQRIEAAERIEAFREARARAATRPGSRPAAVPATAPATGPRK